MERMSNDTEEDLVWKSIDPDDIWILDKLILSKKLGYRCGPTGQDVDSPGWYIVRPCVNMMGLGLGAQRVWLERDTTHLPVGHFWCEWFKGEHYSVDLIPSTQSKIVTVKGFKNTDTFVKWDRWIRVNHLKKHTVPSILYPTILKYSTINIEYIEDKIIEVHFRHNPDFPSGRNEYIPVWEGQDTTPPKGYSYIEDLDVHGRIGAFVK